MSFSMHKTIFLARVLSIDWLINLLTTVCSYFQVWVQQNVEYGHVVYVHKMSSLYRAAIKIFQ
jgi:hypothetical protein